MKVEIGVKTSYGYTQTGKVWFRLEVTSVKGLWNKGKIFRNAVVGKYLSLDEHLMYIDFKDGTEAMYLGLTSSGIRAKEYVDAMLTKIKSRLDSNLEEKKLPTSVTHVITSEVE